MLSRRELNRKMFFGVYKVRALLRTWAPGNRPNHLMVKPNGIPTTVVMALFHGSSKWKKTWTKNLSFTFIYYIPGRGRPGGARCEHFRSWNNFSNEMEKFLLDPNGSIVSINGRNKLCIHASDYYTLPSSIFYLLEPWNKSINDKETWNLH